MNDLQAALRMSENPAEYFSYSLTDMFSLEQKELEGMQLKVLQTRFEQLCDNIPVLTNLVKSSGIDSIEKFEDVVPLLFPHTLYKAYPPSLLERNRYDQMNQWMNKLTAYDLSGVDVSGCEGIDDWLEVLDKETPLLVGHSTGTTGTLSFIPHDAEDYRRWASYWPVTMLQEFGAPQVYDGTCPKMHSIIFNYRYSRRTAGRAPSFLRDAMSGSEDLLHCVHPGSMSTDLQYLAGKMRAAQASGNMDNLNVPPAILARKNEFAQIQAQEEAEKEAFFEKMTKELAGERVFIIAITADLYRYTEAGLERGITNLFAPDSILFTGGGGKGVELPDDWQEKVLKFIGVDRMRMVYGMSEVMGMHPMCPEGHIHFLPSIIPFILDPDTGEMLPRSGTVTGRAAFFDLGTTHKWGGFISGDELTVNWDEPCACGMKGPYLYADKIGRYSEMRGGDDKITCAMTAQAQEEALDFLSEL